MQDHTLTLNNEAILRIVAGLNELPRKISQPVIEEIDRQLRDAQAAQAKNVVKAKADPDAGAAAMTGTDHS